MTDTVKHTPTPWHAHIQSSGHGDGLYDAKVCICTKKPAGQYDSTVAEEIAWTVGSYSQYGSDKYKADVEKNIANAAFIVRAVNAHDDLVKALRGFLLGCGADERALAEVVGEDVVRDAHEILSRIKADVT